MIDLTESSSDSTLSVCSLGDTDETSSTSHGGNYRITASPTPRKRSASLHRRNSELDILVNQSDPRDLMTHFYVADREPAPYAESEGEETDDDIQDIADIVSSDDDEHEYREEDDDAQWFRSAKNRDRDGEGGFHCVLFGGGVDVRDDDDDVETVESVENMKVDKLDNLTKLETNSELKCEEDEVELKIAGDVEGEGITGEGLRHLKHEDGRVNEEVNEQTYDDYENDVTIVKDDNVRIHINVDKQSILPPIFESCSESSDKSDSQPPPIEVPRVLPASKTSKDLAFCIAATGEFWFNQGLEGVNQTTCLHLKLESPQLRYRYQNLRRNIAKSRPRSLVFGAIFRLNVKPGEHGAYLDPPDLEEQFVGEDEKKERPQVYIAWLEQRLMDSQSEVRKRDEAYARLQYIARELVERNTFLTHHINALEMEVRESRERSLFYQSRLKEEKARARLL